MSDALTPVTPDPAALPTHQTDDLWTSDSQRADSIATVDLAADDPEPAADPEPVAPPAPVEATPTTPDPKPKGSGKPRNDPQARVQQATAKEAAAKEAARVLQERADRLEREINDLRQRVTPAAPAPQTQTAPRQSDGRPTWGQFEAKIGAEYATWGDAQDAYNGAWFSWQDEQRVWKSALEDIEQAKAADPAFAKAIDDLPCTPVMGQAIRDSKHRLDIMRFLGSHPETCIQLARESERTSLDAVPVMRRYLEAQVTTGAVARPDSAPVVQPSTANPPINRVGGTANATVVDPDDLDFGPEYIRRENAREKKRQEAGRW